MKCAYATILSSENYTEGVVALYRGLRRFTDKEFVVFVNAEVSMATKAKMTELGITIIEEKEPDFSEERFSDRQLNDRWNKTLFKFVVFKGCGYDKLIYLDSDLLIRGSLDELFELPKFSAVSDADFFKGYGREGLNAGVMVIEPSNELYKRLIDIVPIVSKEKDVFGDQDVINKYLSSMKNEDSEYIDVSYNTCFYDCERVNNPKVVHFILESKPWMWSKKDIIKKKLKWAVTGKFKQIKYCNEYLELLKV